MGYTDGKVKSGEIARRIKVTEKEIDQVVKELNNETEPPEETFLILEEEVLSSVGITIDLGLRHHCRCPRLGALHPSQLHCLSKDLGIPPLKHLF